MLLVIQRMRARYDAIQLSTFVDAIAIDTDNLAVAKA
jgi:hypothetical protein